MLRDDRSSNSRNPNGRPGLVRGTVGLALDLVRVLVAVGILVGVSALLLNGVRRALQPGTAGGTALVERMALQHLKACRACRESGVRVIDLIDADGGVRHDPAEGPE